MTGSTSQFMDYLDDQLEQRGWTLTDLAERSGLSPSVIFRYRRGYRPTMDNARALAHTLEVPLLEVLVVSGVLTEAEAHHYLNEPTVLSTVSTVALAKEQLARAEAYDKVQRDYEAQQQDLSAFTSALENLTKQATLRLDSSKSWYITKHKAPDNAEETPDDGADDLPEELAENVDEVGKRSR